MPERKRQLGATLVYGVCVPLVLLVLMLAVVFWGSVSDAGSSMVPMYLIVISLAAGLAGRLGSF